MKFLKPMCWIGGLSVVAFVSTLDLGGLSDWSANRIFILPETILHADVDVPLHIEVKAQRPDPFGNYEDIVVPDGQYTLTMKPLDDHSEEFAIFDAGTVTCSRRAILHVEFCIELLPSCEFQFMSSDRPGSSRWQQLIAVDIDPVADWQEIDVSTEPEHIQRHLSVMTREEFHGDASKRFVWRPSNIVSNKEVTVMTRGYVLFDYDGSQDRELPRPPSGHSQKAMCLFQKKLILAGGIAGDVLGGPQLVSAFDLKSQTWEELPHLPDKIQTVRAVFEQDGQLVIVATLHSDANSGTNAPATFVLRNEQWQMEQASKYGMQSGNVFGVKTGALSINTVDSNASIKHLENGRLQTIAIASGPSIKAPVTVIDDRVLQWVNGRVYELDPYLFLDQPVADQAE